MLDGPPRITCTAFEMACLGYSHDEYPHWLLRGLSNVLGAMYEPMQDGVFCRCIIFEPPPDEPKETAS